MDPVLDCLIIGAGLAGLSAAVSLVRTLHTAVVFDAGVYRNDLAPHLATIPTWDTKDPKRFRDEAKLNILNKYSTVQFADVPLVKIEKVEIDGVHNGLFKVWDKDQHAWLGKKVILATGVEDIFPDIPGYSDCWIKGIFHCLVHRGYEERGSKDAAVLAIESDANLFAARHLAFQARNLATNVTIYTNNNSALTTELETVLGPLGFSIEGKQIEQFIKGAERAQVEVVLADGKRKTEAFIIHRPRTQIRGPFAEQLGLELTPEGHIKTSFPFNETSVSGVFVAGDAATQFKIGTQAVVMGAFAAGGVQMQVNAETWGKPAAATE